MSGNFAVWLCYTVVTVVIALIIGVCFRWYYGHRDRQDALNDSKDLRDE